jgi:acetylglutamate synthase
MKVEQLKNNLEKLSATSTSFQNQATECEKIYQSKDEIKKLIYSKQSDNLVLTRQNLLKNVKDLKEGLTDVSEHLLSIWRGQEMEVFELQSRIKKYCHVRQPFKI